ncbi:glutamyl-tRNA reductase [Sediminitomix flava]|uniref:Glutamyl-tRNA reductase n=1 Tax=Sediminitomix flava TaxID=379075 RepID=A0A315ZI78_SEDFL|nr:glutamyl-tRNA reductase [Sediminitomix flava]PWJ44919.1 glutamyl-tRNA reductase [Sediminitomix flava]
MLENFKAISASYKSTPLEVRELLAISDLDAGDFINKAKEVFEDLNDLLVVSTCNRTEVYYTSSEDLSSELIKLICAMKGMTSEKYQQYFVTLNDHFDAIRHLYRVSMGLESQVVGDIQISNQIKRAYQLSADLDMAGPFLHRMMHSVFYTNKRVSQETAFRNGAASVSYAAVEMIEELTVTLLEPKVLVVGTGEIGADTVRNLKNTNIENVQITNRTFEKAEQLATECDYKALPFDQLWDAAHKADVIISSLPIADFFSKEKVSELEILAFKCFVDLSVPRSVAVDVENIPGVLVYNVDDINNRASKALEKRKASIPQVEAIIEEAISEFGEWAREMVFSPTIQKLKSSLEQIRQEEIGRYMKGLEDDEIKKIDKITKGIMNKIIKIPVLQLKAACKRDEAETLVDVLNDLFNLEAQDLKKK